MKTSYLAAFILLLLMIEKASAQYVPLAVEGKYWVNIRHFVQEVPQPISGYAIVIGADTILNGQLYHEVYKQELAGLYIPTEGGFMLERPYRAESTELIAFLREDMEGEKVYSLPIGGLNFCESEEHLLFDFSLEEGQTLNSCAFEAVGGPDDPTNWGIVDSTEVVNGRTTIYTTGIASTIGLAVIDQIRIIEGLGFQGFDIYRQGQTTLADYCEGGDAMCEMITSTRPVLNTSNLQIFPNPSRGTFHITLTESSIKNISVYTIDGKFQQVDYLNNAVDLSAFDNGIYLLRFTLKNGEQYLRRVIKQH